MTENNKPVATPWGRKLRFFGRKIVPLLAWIAVIGMIAWLARHRVYHMEAVGIVEKQSALLVAPMDGRIIAMGVSLFDQVKQGDVLALMDDKQFRLQAQTARAEMDRLKAALTAMHVETAGLIQDELRRYQLNAEEARLDLLDRQVAMETDRVQLLELRMNLERYGKLVEENIMDRESYDILRLQEEALETKIKENEKAIAYARQMLKEAERRLADKQKDKPETLIEAGIEPLSQEIRAQQSRIEEMNALAENLVLRAPLSGMISNISKLTGENVLAGTELLQISAPESNTVLGYIADASITDIHEGDTVQLISRRNPREIVHAKIIKVGSSIERFPNRLRPDPNRPQWGLSIRIGAIPENQFYPGEVLDIRLRPVLN
ncbi:MAG: HlyD family secretion protein [Candidatus Sumerlaeia bacterium]